MDKPSIKDILLNAGRKPKQAALPAVRAAPPPETSPGKLPGKRTGRPPIGAKAMTDTERKRRYRAKLRASKQAPET